MNRHPIGVAGYDRSNESHINATRPFTCHPGGTTEAAIIFTLGSLGVGANLVLMFLILSKRYLRRWSLGLLFHQALVDMVRATLLIPLGVSILNCQPVGKCSMVETAFLLLVTASTINLLTTVLNDAPLQPDDEDEDEHIPLLMESPQCVLFGSFMIWFASITINLGPTFLSGALAANIEEEHHAPSCPLVAGPLRHYVLNVLWIMINVLCVILTIFHLHKLYRDLGKSNVQAVRIASLVTTMISVSAPDSDNRDPRRVSTHIQRMEREGIERVKMFVVIVIAYLVFWGPLFLVTLARPGGFSLLPSGRRAGLPHEVTLHIAFVHSFVNPALFLALHKGLRRAALDLICCNYRGGGEERVEEETFHSYPSLSRSYLA
ncbi:uncharacterized protein LOC119103030 [Pollicipes pollicipes]|uniref:uncharacterized protein LOC119103030 n=1 Tax=Pollicipes pollicipes TaxID=41117 RepID=UPI0018854677|nr:uncharacterized protein LOC119103030 [Pollicipes pollicipes]